MYFSTSTKIYPPSIKRLQTKRDCLSCEIDQLSRELHILKDVIRSKQKRLRKMNTAIIIKSTRGPHLSVITGTCTDIKKVKRQGTLANNPLETILTCLQGGKASSLEPETNKVII